MTIHLAITAAATVSSSVACDPDPLAGLGPFATLPPVSVRRIDDSNPDLGNAPKGIRHLDRTSKLALAVVRKLVDSLTAANELGDPLRTGVVVATAGSLRASTEFYRDTVTGPSPEMVSAKGFPTTVLNCAASQVAIHTGLKGTNATIMGENNASIAAVRFAANMIRGGHLDRAVVIGVDELSAQRAWTRYRAGCTAATGALGEGAAAVLVQRVDDHTSSPRVLSSVSRAAQTVAGVVDHAAALRDAIAKAVKRSGLDSDSIDAVYTTCSLRDDLAAVERGVLADTFNLEKVVVRDLDPMIGDVSSANGLLQLVASTRDPESSHALITSVENDGCASALVVAS